MGIGVVRKSRWSALVALSAAGTLMLAACTPSGGQSGAASADAPEPEKLELAEYFVQPTDIEVPGLTGQRIESSTGSEARWSYLPGDLPFNDVLAETVGAQLQAQAQTRDATYSPEAHERNAEWLNRGCVAGSTALTGREILDNPELSITPGADTVLAVACDTVLASGTNYGQRLRFVRGNSSEVVSDQVEILYTNTETGDVARGKELFQEEGLPTLYEAVLELKGIEGPMSGDEPVAPSAETLADLQSSLSNVGFDDSGDIFVTVDQNFIAFLAGGQEGVEIAPTTLKIPASRATELLTELGAGISQSKATAEAWAGPDALPSGREYVDCDLVPCVAVTYDDGPSSLTPQVVEVYSARPYAATTLFVLGQNIAGQEEIVKQAYDAGNEIANHSWDHPALTTLDDASILAEINDTSAAITAVTGEEVKHLRPPYGDYNEHVLSVVNMPAILWSVDTNDWQLPGYDALMAEAVGNAHPGGIILMHDIHEPTVAAAADIADGLLERGFTLVTVSQLFGDRELELAGYWGSEEVL